MAVNNDIERRLWAAADQLWGKSDWHCPCWNCRRRNQLSAPQGREAMRVHFDDKADALYFRLDDSKIAESEEVRPGIVFDFNGDDQVVGIEILRLKDRVPLANLRQMQFEVA